MKNIQNLLDNILTKMNHDKIHKFCKDNNILKYTINDDGSIDVDQMVIINKKMKRIPIKFNKVYGSFYCRNIGLLTLENSPNYVGGTFYSDNNKLTSLYGCPKNVVGYFFVLDNPLETLDGYNNFEDLYYKYLSCDNQSKLVSKHKRSNRLKHILNTL